jgi:PTS system nitrogen regulatory IIA component
MVRLKQPIDFEAIDGQPVDLVFLLLLPAAAEGEQLGALACVARKLRAPADLTKLRRARNASELHAVLSS